MIPVEQTTFGTGRGNCFSACIASILELPISEVPSFCDEEQDSDGSNWFDRAAEWLLLRGYGLLYIGWEESEGAAGIVPLNCWVICTGVQRGGHEHHAVVGRTRTSKPVKTGEHTYRREWEVEFVYDPNPKQSFLESLGAMILLVPGASG